MSDAMLTRYAPAQRLCAEYLFDYLALTSPDLQQADGVWGFGHFDLRIPRWCGELYRRGCARHIIFSGGMGSGTADLGQPEAHAFQAELARHCPQIPADALTLEDASTNTGENVAYTCALLKRARPEMAFGRGIRSCILAASPYRQRRVWLTCRHQLPGLTLINAPPQTTFAQERARFAAKGFDLIDLLLGEIDRLRRYAAAGYIPADPIPAEVSLRYRQLQDAMVSVR